MDKEKCLEMLASTPNYVVNIFWIFVFVLMLAIILAIITAGLHILIECYQEMRESYLRNRQRKIQLELLEKQKNGN